MKSLFYVFPLLIFSYLNCQELIAQNFQSVYSTDIKLFDRGYTESEILGFKIDSLILDGNDSIFYPTRTVQMVDESICYKPYGSSWISSSVRIQPNGINYFYNAHGESIKIHALDSLFAHWVAFESSELQIIASITELDTISVFDVTDSAKTITFQAYDWDGQEIENIVNDKSIVLSKNYGLIQTLNFDNFPEYYNGFYYSSLHEYKLVGNQTVNQGIHNLTYMEVFDFDEGDEIHTHSDYGTSFFGPVTETDESKVCLEKIDYIDSVTYKFKRQILIHTGEEFISNLIDTIEFTVRPNLIFDQLPVMTYTQSNSSLSYSISSYYTMYFNNGRRNKIDKQYWRPLITEIGDSCSFILEENQCQQDQNYSYREGLGGPYYQCVNLPFVSTRMLVYYHKGGIGYGTPIDFALSANGTPDSPVVIALYPNPARDILRIVIRKDLLNGELSLYDTHGKLVKMEKVISEDWLVDISGLPNGIYFYRYTVTGKDGSGKLVIQQN